MKIPSLKICTTTACNLNCSGCSAASWRRNNPRYQLTLKQLRAAIKAVTDSGYTVARCIFTGGEPLLWPKLKKAIIEARESGVMGCIEVWTSTMPITRPTASYYIEALRQADVVGVSDVSCNALQRMILRENHVNIALTPRKNTFFLRPDVPVPDSLPAMCNCNHIEICGGSAYACGLVHWNSEELGVPVPEGMMTDVSPGFMERLDVAGSVMMPMCARCTSNAKVRGFCPTVAPV